MRQRRLAGTRPEAKHEFAGTIAAVKARIRLLRSFSQKKDPNTALKLRET